MNKYIFVAAAVATVAVTSGCQRTTVRTVRHPAEVVDTRTVIVDHHDGIYRERRDPPRVIRERIIERERVVRPAPVYVPPRREVPHRYEERRYEEPRYPRPPAHSNSRIIREEVRQAPPRRDDPGARRAPQRLREMTPPRRERIPAPVRNDRRPLPRTAPNNARLREQMQQSHQAKPQYRDRKVVKSKSHDKKERYEEKKNNASRDQDHENKRSSRFGRD